MQLREMKIKACAAHLRETCLARSVASDAQYAARTCVACSTVHFGLLHLPNMGCRQMLITEPYI